VLDGANMKGLRVVLDCANGAAYRLGPELFRSVGCDVVTIGSDPDGRNINAGCGSMHLEKLQARVPAEKAALGVAFDGDADRALFVSASGEVINGDGILLAAARYLKHAGKLPGNRVVATSMSNLGLERVLADEGIAMARTNVGDRYRPGRDAQERQRFGRRTVRAHHFSERLARGRRIAHRAEDSITGCAAWKRRSVDKRAEGLSTDHREREGEIEAAAAVDTAGCEGAARCGNRVGQERTHCAALFRNRNVGPCDGGSGAVLGR